MQRHPLLLGSLLLASLLLLAACQSPPREPAPTPTPPPAAVDDSADTCGSRDYAWLVGEPYKSVPAAPEGKVIRVVCSTCAMTMDYNAQRVNVIYDETSGRVTKLNCG